MSKGPLIVGGVLLGGAALWLATRERTLIEGAVTNVYAAQAEGARRAAVTARGFVRQAMSGVSDAAIARIRQHDIVNLVDTYRGRVPWGVGMAMVEHESDFFPDIYNYYIVENGQKTRKLGRAYAAVGAALVDRWRKPGDAGCQYDPHACGLLQILDQLRLDQKFKYGGVALPYLNDLFDPAKNLHAALAARDGEVGRILAAAPGASGALLAALIYFAHAEGLGKLVGGKYPGAFARLKALGKPVTWENIIALPWGAVGWWSLGNRLSGIAQVAARAAVWDAARANLSAPASAQVGADVAPVVPPDAVDALLMAAQAAEMERDLSLAAQLRAELAQLTGSPS